MSFVAMEFLSYQYTKKKYIYNCFLADFTRLFFSMHVLVVYFTFVLAFLVF